MMKMKMMKKSKKTVKGMTLIECIIAMLVVGVTGMIMAKTVTTACSIMYNTNRMNNKIAVEKPVVSSQDVVTVTNAGVTPESVNFTVTSGSASGTVRADKYDTFAVANASGKDCYTNSTDATKTSRDANMWFYVIDYTAGP